MNTKKVKNNEDIFQVLRKIEKARSSNNINWMNILRIAIKNSSKDTIKVMKKIKIYIKFFNYFIISMAKS